MFIRHHRDCEKFISGDGAHLRELFHPEKHPLELNYSFAHAVVPPGEATVPHVLKESSEVYYILEGEGTMHIDEDVETVQAGQVVYIPPGARQFIENETDSDLVFLCLVDPAWREEDEVIL